ncbi:hypothetical protein Syun_009462 [Stephania yunnanensis]|uniref:Uncharacterized protein n=1 Tax=Stephania yunnanensis TaxID=152371 RepID=A0AAP0KEJ7_9MAGN
MTSTQISGVFDFKIFILFQFSNGVIVMNSGVLMHVLVLFLLMIWLIDDNENLKFEVHNAYFLFLGGWVVEASDIFKTFAC